METNLIDVIEADLASPSHGGDIVRLLNNYALDLMGGGTELPTYAKNNLIAELRKRPAVRVILAFADGEAVGLAICMEGFSTFACKPLLNVHDIMVVESCRGRGIAKMMLAKVEEIAHRLGCCKITLEVLEGNRAAQSLYRASGFAGYALDPAMGHALFWQKKL